MEKSGSGKIIFTSVILSLLVVGAGIYFGLPYLYPILKEEDEDLVLQIKWQEFKTVCILWDSQLTVKSMNDTSLSIKTQGDSYLSIEFSTNLMYGVDSAFDTGSSYDFMSYNITMAVSGDKNYSVVLEYGELKAGQWGTTPFSMKIISPILEKGTYNITMYWVSRIDATGSNYISANHYTNYKNNPRLLYIEEIRSN